MVELYNTGSLLVMSHSSYPFWWHLIESLEDPEVLLPLATFQTSGQPFFQRDIDLTFSSALGQRLSLVTGIEPLHQLRCASQLWDFWTGGRTAA